MQGTGKQATILIVDDTPVNLQILANALKAEYLVKIATNGEKAVEIAAAAPHPDLILLDIMMPVTDGYEVCRRLKAEPDTARIPVIFITATAEHQSEAKGLALGAVDYIQKPFVPELVQARIRNHLELKLHRDQLEELVQQRTRELELTQDVMIECVCSLAESRDSETKGHIKRTRLFVSRLAKKLQKNPNYAAQLDEGMIRQLYRSTPLHDLGMILVPEEILRKPGKLTEAEFNRVKEHTSRGRDTIAQATRSLGSDSFLACAQEIAASHHEKWDGSGYPQGLRGAEIPLSGRLMAVADVYDALISKRVYRPPVPHEQAVAVIREGRGSHFDPEIVEAFLEIGEDLRRIAQQYADSDAERQNLAGPAEAPAAGASGE